MYHDGDRIVRTNWQLPPENKYPYFDGLLGTVEEVYGESATVSVRWDDFPWIDYYTASSLKIKIYDEPLEVDEWSDLYEVEI